MSRSQRSDAVAEVLERVGLPLDIAKSRAGQLSGGQRQRVSLARATVVPPVGAAVRRADQRARRVAGRFGAQPHRRSAPQPGHVGGVRDPRPVGRPRGRRPDRRDVPGPHRRDRARRTRSSAIPRTPTPRRWSTRSPTSAANHGCCQANPPARCRRRPAARSTRAARSPIDTCGGDQLDVRLEGVPGNPHQVACIERRAS